MDKEVKTYSAICLDKLVDYLFQKNFKYINFLILMSDGGVPRSLLFDKRKINTADELVFWSDCSDLIAEHEVKVLAEAFNIRHNPILKTTGIPDVENIHRFEKRYLHPNSKDVCSLFVYDFPEEEKEHYIIAYFYRLVKVLDKKNWLTENLEVALYVDCKTSKILTIFENGMLVKPFYDSSFGLDLAKFLSKDVGVTVEASSYKEALDKVVDYFRY